MIQVTREQLFERWDDLSDLLREAIYSPFYNEEIENISGEFHLSERRYQDLAYLCLLVFSGFLRIQDLYKEIGERLGIDNRIALDIYQQLEQKVFGPLRGEIDANYLQHKIGTVKESDIEHPQRVQEEVILKKEPSGTLNLKQSPAQPVVGAPIQIITDEPIPADMPPPAQVHQESSEPTRAPSEPTPSFAQASREEGPVVIHQKEETQSISQAQPTGGYKHMSFGGFFGTKQQQSSFEKQPTRATIETPSEFGVAIFSSSSQNQTQGGRIPVSIKQREEKPKTVHYSAMRTNLSAPKQEEQPKQNEGFVDLNNLTIKDKR